MAWAGCDSPQVWGAFSVILWLYDPGLGQNLHLPGAVVLDGVGLTGAFKEL